MDKLAANRAAADGTSRGRDARIGAAEHAELEETQLCRPRAARADSASRAGESGGRVRDYREGLRMAARPLRCTATQPVLSRGLPHAWLLTGCARAAPFRSQCTAMRLACRGWQQPTPSWPRCSWTSCDFAHTKTSVRMQASRRRFTFVRYGRTDTVSYEYKDIGASVSTGLASRSHVCGSTAY